MDAPSRSPDLMQIRQAQLPSALIACTEGICEINVTRNTVLSAHTPDERHEPGALCQENGKGRQDRSFETLCREIEAGHRMAGADSHKTG